MKAEEFDAITETIRHRSYDDRALMPECFQHALDTLREIVTDAECPYLKGNPPHIETHLHNAVTTAEQALRRMVLRAETGVPFDEPPHTEEHL